MGGGGGVGLGGGLRDFKVFSLLGGKRLGRWWYR